MTDSNNTDHQIGAKVSGLIVLLAGAKRFSLWRGKEGFINPPGISKTTLISDKRKLHKIDRDEISNFCTGYFQVRSILRSPEATKNQILRK